MKYTHFFLISIFIPSLSYGMKINQKNSVTIVNFHRIDKATKKITTISSNNNKEQHKIKKNSMIPLDPEGINIVYDPYVHKTYSRS